MKEMEFVFDYDDTLVSSSGEVMPLLQLLVDKGVKEIAIWSNGNKWDKDGVLKSLGIVAKHVTVPNPIEEGINKFMADFEFCQEQAKKIGQEHNVSVPKYANKIDGILVDDLAPIWSKISGVKVLTPEEAIEILNNK